MTARFLPNAAFIGFTGTPIELTDKNTRAVFDDYILQQAELLSDYWTEATA